MHYKAVGADVARRKNRAGSARRGRCRHVALDAGEAVRDMERSASEPASLLLHCISRRCGRSKCDSSEREAPFTLRRGCTAGAIPIALPI